MLSLSGPVHLREAYCRGITSGPGWSCEVPDAGAAVAMPVEPGLARCESHDQVTASINIGPTPRQAAARPGQSIQVSQ